MSPARLLLVVALASLAACREGTESSNAQSTFLPIPTAAADGSSCSGSGLAPAATPTAMALATLNVGASSQLCAEAGTQLLFATGGDGAVVQLDVSGASPVETVLVNPGTFDALLAGPLIGIATPAELVGICVVDAARLAVVEATSNTLWLVGRLVADDVTLVAGFPGEAPGFANGPSALSRFAFSAPTGVVATGEGTLLVADPGNHAVRRVELGTGGLVSTVAGLGTPFFADGAIDLAAFDTPTSLALACTGELLVVENGAAGLGGHRLRELRVGAVTFFGALGSVATLAGDGTDATIGGTAASLAAPTGLLTTADDEAYWVDATTGVLRRLDLATGVADCPGFVDCATATGMPGAFAGPGASLAYDDVGDVLYVLDPSAATLYSL